MKSQEKIVILLGDIAFPLIGFFFWNWGFYFIALYFIIDQLAKQAFLIVRLKNISLQFTEKAILLSKSMALFFFEVLIIILINYQMTVEFNPINGIIKFLSYEDMGIQQGVVLIPLLIFAEWMKMKTEQKLKQSDELKQQNINRSLQQSQIRLSMLGIILGIVNFNMLTELLIVILFLIGIGLSVFAPLKKIIKQA
ncbi:MAG: hypothetical protein NT109_01570 [Flavobacteriia bacterium]|nr:hypothetical protein [Flavobacteriia bacterium]